ncbi:MAG: type II toxin-antitoxin system RatA family toxin [Halieaceae bacterium]|jgi:ribosome-associated toxin RatA of RatAB toxin-antitoxin module|nr:type II toxin-antitoxin system RatA family toxin [Halieaceae bacterium]
MSRIDRSALLPYPADKLFALVNDIEAYPQYMEGCVGAEVLRDDGSVIEARLDLARAGIRQSFATRNRLLPPERIELSLIEGPFEHFAGVWEFKALGDSACRVSLVLEFTLRSPVLGAAAGKLFESVASHLVEAISSRARALY